MKFVTKRKFAEDHGLTIRQVEKRIERKWTRGIHYFVESSGVTMIDVGAVEKLWVEEKQAQLSPKATESRSVTPILASASGSRLT